jgi:hypothetical protein
MFSTFKRLAFTAAVVFFLNGLSVSQNAGAVTVTDKSAVGELAFWNSVKESANPEDLKTYIDEFPNGMFFDPAVARYQNLTGQRLASVPQVDEAEQVLPTNKTQPVVTKKPALKKKTSSARKPTGVAKTATAKKLGAGKRVSNCRFGVDKNGKCIVRTAVKKKRTAAGGETGGSSGSSGAGGGGWN